jgi:hypothetical protein
MKTLTFSLFFSLVGLLVTGTSAYAEGGCPQGQIPYSGTNIGSCGPIPGYGQERQAVPQPPPPEWASRWGAIAADAVPVTVFVGHSAGMLSRASAEQFAMSDCHAKGGISCEILVSYANACGSIAVGNSSYVASGGATQEEAIQKSLHICSANTTNCRTAYTTCSSAVRIR